MKRASVLLILTCFFTCLVFEAQAQQRRRATRPRPTPAQTPAPAKQPDAGTPRQQQPAAKASPAPKVDPAAARLKAEEELMAGKGVAINATLTRGQFRSGNVTSPTWEVTFVIKNDSERELQLGESLIVLEKAREDPRFAANYVVREAEQPTAHTKRIEERYNLAWGYKIYKGGGPTIIAFPNASGDIMAFMSSITFLYKESYEGNGFGRVKPHSERKVETQVISPVGLKDTDMREYVAVVLPDVRLADAEVRFLPRTVLRFNVGEQKPDSTFSPTEMISIPVRLSDLRAAVADVNQHVWRRTFALNWLTEVYPAEASELLLELATKEASPMVRNAAVLDLGVAKVKAAVQPLMGMAQQSTDEALRRLAIVALGDIGDPASAPAIRPYLNDKDERVAALATDAIGGVRDADSVGTLLAIMKDKSKVKRRDRVGDALAAIGNREAVEGLLAFLRDPKGDMRELAAEKLALTKAPEAIAALVALTNDSNTPAKLHEAILKALGRVGGKEADDAAIAALRSAHAEVRKTAAMGIRESKVAGAVAPLWSAYQAEADKDAGIEIAAALVELKFADKSVVPFLVRRLDAKKNKLWYSDVKLLRHLTDQKFGPESPYGDEKDRDAELSKWREWWQQQPGAQPAP